VGLAGIAEHATAIIGAATTVGVVLRCGSDALLRLIAGITAITARDKRTRAQRALDVLRRNHQPPPPGAGSPG